MPDVLALYSIPDRYSHDRPAYVHDHNLTHWADGQVQTHLHLERYSRRKYDNRLPLFLEELLDQPVFSPSPETELISVTSFVGSSMSSTNGRFRLEANPWAPVSAELTPAKAYWQASPWQGYELKAWSISHELAHIGSCLPFFGSFQDNSLLVHFDGGASQGNFSAFLYRDGQLNLLACHWELSHLSKLFNDNALSFALMQANPGEHTSVPGKLMGYAALGSYRPEIADWLAANDHFRSIWKDKKPFYERAFQDFGWQGRLDQQQDPFLQDVAAAMQGIFQNGLLKYLQHLQEQVQADNLYLAGGCALNIIANTAIVDSGLFRQVFIPPACNDSGLSLGAAAFLAWQRGEVVQPHSPYLNNLGVSESYPVHAELIQVVAELLVQGKIVGVANGAGEAGPRALGNRSLLARADSPALARRLSMDCKQREWFRPVAPIMLESVAKKVTEKPFSSHLTRYMLQDCRILPQYQSQLSGVIHAGNSARIQTLSQRSENPFLFDLLTYVHEQHGMIALTNTSFNAQGEPIVHSSEQALASARRMGLDAVVLQGKLKILVPSPA